jgi:hypothetical protein
VRGGGVVPVVGAVRRRPGQAPGGRRSRPRRPRRRPGGRPRAARRRWSRSSSPRPCARRGRRGRGR